MASLTDVKLYEFDAAPTTIILRALPVADLVSTDICLHEFDATATTIILRALPCVVDAAPPTFPTQFAGLRTYYGAAVRELCLVATADAPTGMGGSIRINKNGTTYAVYLVETTDPDASSVRVNTSAGTKSIRLKT